MTGPKTTKTKSIQRAPKAKMAPQVAALRAKGMTVKEIAKKINRSERATYDILRWGNQNGTSLIIEIPDPKSYEDLDLAVMECVKFTVEGFEKFFNRYSGRKLQPIHKQWVKDALENPRVLINCPPRHAKSTIFTVWVPLWLICINRDVQILVCSQTEKLAKKFTNEISYHLAYNSDLIRDFGRFRPEMADWPWRPNSGELLVDGRKRETKSGDLTIQVRGSEQQILGMECDWVICDDPVSRKHVTSDTQREELSVWFHGDVLTRLEPQGRAICIGQRLHLHDLYGELSEERIMDHNGDSVPRWKHLNYPAIQQWPDKEQGIEAKVLWPDKWSFEALMERYADLGAALFEAMFQQNPLPEGERLCRREWMYGDGEHQGCLDFDRDGRVPAELKQRVRVLSLDPSPTRYAALIVADLEWNRGYFECHVLEIVRDKMAVRDMLWQIERCLDAYQPHYFVFEQNAAQRWFLQDPAMDTIRRRVRVLPHSTGRNKGDPTLGIESLAIDFEFGRIRLPYGDAEAKAMSQYLIDEALTYPQSKTDDVLMALWFMKFNYGRLVPRKDLEDREKPVGGFRTPARLAKGYRWTQNQPQRRAA